MSTTNDLLLLPDDAIDYKALPADVLLELATHDSEPNPGLPHDRCRGDGTADHALTIARAAHRRCLDTAISRA